MVCSVVFPFFFFLFSLFSLFPSLFSFFFCYTELLFRSLLLLLRCKLGRGRGRREGGMRRKGRRMERVGRLGRSGDKKVYWRWGSWESGWEIVSSIGLTDIVTRRFPHPLPPHALSRLSYIFQHRCSIMTQNFDGSFAYSVGHTTKMTRNQWQLQQI